MWLHNIEVKSYGCYKRNDYQGIGVDGSGVHIYHGPGCLIDCIKSYIYIYLILHIYILHILCNINY